METKELGVLIPIEVWKDKRLNALEKIILSELNRISVDGCCKESNEYFALTCNCSLTKVSLAISKFVSLGYIYIESFDGRQRIIKKAKAF